MALNEGNQDVATGDILDRLIPLAGVVSAIIMGALVFIGAGGPRTVNASNDAAITASVPDSVPMQARFVPVVLR